MKARKVQITTQQPLLGHRPREGNRCIQTTTTRLHCNQNQPHWWTHSSLDQTQIFPSKILKLTKEFSTNKAANKTLLRIIVSWCPIQRRCMELQLKSEMLGTVLFRVSLAAARSEGLRLMNKVSTLTVQLSRLLKATKTEISVVRTLVRLKTNGWTKLETLKMKKQRCLLQSTTWWLVVDKNRLTTFTPSNMRGRRGHRRVMDGTEGTFKVESGKERKKQSDWAKHQRTYGNWRTMKTVTRSFIITRKTKKNQRSSIILSKDLLQQLSSEVPRKSKSKN